MRSEVRRAGWFAAVVCVAVASFAWNPVGSAAQEPPGAGAGPGGGRGARLTLDIDVLRSEEVQVAQALADVRDNVAEQQRLLEAAQQALSEAEGAVAEAEAAVAEANERIAGLNAVTDSVVIEAFVNPPTETALEALTADSLSDSTVKKAILDRRANSDADLLAELQAAQADLEADTARREAAAAEAAARRSEAETALADVEAALSQQSAFILAVQQRLDRNLAEAEALEDIDPALADELRAREAELAAALHELDAEVQAERAREQAATLAAQAQANKTTGAVIKPVPGGVTSITCPTGGSISLAGDIAGAVERLLADAAAEGVMMCGKGYRDPQAQIAVRRSNCGTSYYAIWQMPSSSCSPPTARPGTSMHEQGLAIDFSCGASSTVRWGDVCYNWMNAHAADYGLYNLPSEPWHWSVDGN